MSWRKCECGEKTLFSVCDVCHSVSNYDESCKECNIETTPLCFSCAINGVESPKKEFLDSLSSKQKVLFEEYNQALSIKTSVIILD